MPRIEGTELQPGVFFPAISVALHGPGNHILSVMALIDSGADRTIIPAEVLEAIGIPYASLALGARQGAGVGGGFETRTCSTLILKWREWEIAREIEVAEFRKLPLPLLGRGDFFRKFSIRFGWHRDPPTIDIDPIT